MGKLFYLDLSSCINFLKYGTTEKLNLFLNKPFSSSFKLQKQQQRLSCCRKYSFETNCWHFFINFNFHYFTLLPLQVLVLLDFGIFSIEKPCKSRNGIASVNRCISVNKVIFDFSVPTKNKGKTLQCAYSRYKSGSLIWRSLINKRFIWFIFRNRKYNQTLNYIIYYVSLQIIPLNINANTVNVADVPFLTLWKILEVSIKCLYCGLCISRASKQKCSIKKVLWQISQNSRENTCFLIKLHDEVCNLCLSISAFSFLAFLQKINFQKI